MGNFNHNEKYQEFVARYKDHPIKMMIEVFGMLPSQQQIELLSVAVFPSARVSVSSGHGTGKTMLFAFIGLWHLTTHVMSNTFITAPKLDTVAGGVWKEFADLTIRMRANGYGWLADFIILEQRKVYIKGYKLNWYISPKTAPKGSPENLAGTHRTALLWLADEATGIPDANFGVIGGSMTGGDMNRFIIASQPTRSQGYFYDTHHRMSVSNGGVWIPLVFNSEQSELVSDEFIREKQLEYGGRDAIEYQIKVLGLFPDQAEGMLLGRNELEKCFVKDGQACVNEGHEYGIILSSDVGGGNFRDSSVLISAKVIGYGDEGEDARRVHIESIGLKTNSLKEPEFAGEVFNYMTETRTLNSTLMVDKGGGGSSVIYLLESKGVPQVVGVQWGKPCWTKKYVDRFMNQRAQCNWFAGNAVRNGRLTFSDSIPMTTRTEILDEGSRIPYFWNENQRIQMVKKEDMKKEGIHSPDLWDAICQFFLESAYYSVVNDSFEMKTKKQKAIDKASDFFDSI